ncbi:MAG: DUF2167 domain-containing protein [Paucibacter sp.]|nr:DUF2167 domain-containing protein [Roseateles sp.]
MRAFGILALLGLLAAPAFAADEPSGRNELSERIRRAAIDGPKDVPLAGQARLHLPAGKVFLPQPEAGEMMRAMGNPGDYKDLQGLVLPKAEGAPWFVVVSFEKAGYVKDDDAKDWKADELLSRYRDGTEAANQERSKMGVTPIEIVGWAETPKYDAATHRLVWAMSLRDKGSTDTDQGVNYNTYALGREGFFTLNLVTGLKDLPARKDEARDLLAALEFDAGKRYADFNSSTDHVAEYGLAALVIGVGAKKLGLLAIAFAFVAKFAKLAILVVAGAGAAVAKFFKRKPETPPPQA